MTNAEIETLLKESVEKIRVLEEKVVEIESSLNIVQDEVDHPFGCPCTACGNF